MNGNGNGNAAALRSFLVTLGATGIVTALGFGAAQLLELRDRVARIEEGLSLRVKTADELHADHARRIEALEGRRRSSR